ncbi:MAG: ATP-binding protein [bacterium]
MQIREIHIDGFGIFSDRHIAGLGPGINIVYGDNEFGKSTILEFIRRILFGFPRSSPGTNPYPALAGGPYGGKLVCELKNGKMVTIARTTGTHGGQVSLLMDSHEFSGQDAVSQILDHITRTFFENVYAIGLDELQEVKSLQEEKVKGFIYGAGLGLGGISLDDIKGAFRAAADALYRPRGSTQRIPEIYSSIKHLEKQIRDIQGNLSKYDHLVNSRSRLIEEVKDLDGRIRKMQRDQQSLENKNKLYPAYLKLVKADSELSQLECVPDFPEDILEKLDTLKREHSDLSKRIHEKDEPRLKGLELQKEGLHHNEDLLKQEAAVLSLLGLSEKYRSDSGNITIEKRKRAHLAEKIRTEIERMGEGWSEDRIRDYELTLLESDRIRGFEKELDEAGTRLGRAEDKLARHRDIKSSGIYQGFSGPDMYRYAIYCMTAFGLIGVISGIYISVSLAVFSGIILCVGLLFSILISRGRLKKGIKDPLEETYQEELVQARSESTRVKEEWKAFLGQMNLYEMLSPKGALETIRTIQNIRSDLARIDESDERIEQMQETIQRVQALYDRISPCIEKPRLGEDMDINIRQIGELLNDAKEIKGKKTGLEMQVRELSEEIKGLHQEMAKKEGEIQGYIASFGVPDEKDLREKYQVFERCRALKDESERCKELIQLTVGMGEDYHRFMTSMSDTNPEDLAQGLMGLKGETEVLIRERDARKESIGELNNQIEILASSKELLNLQNESEFKKQELRDCSRDWVKAKMAMLLLEKAISKYENTRQPEVIKAANHIFSSVTNHRYASIVKPLDSDELLIRQRHGNPKGVTEMSRGTREQLYFAMRLGLIKEYESRSEPMPVIMDDIFVNFDDQRNPRAIRTLEAFAKERQVIVLTCHRSTLEKYLSLGAQHVDFC